MAITRSAVRTNAPATPASDTQHGEPLPAPPPDTRRLHEATDELNKKLLDVEAALNELKLGVSAQVLMDENQNGWNQHLAFRKQQGSFKLVVESGFESDDQSWSTTAITSASRETRLHAVELLPKLYQKLLEAFETEITRVKKSVVQLEGLAQAIRAKAGK